MSLRRTVAVPFRQDGVEQLRESQFVVALSLDRDWFSPDQATRLVDVATGEGLLERQGEDLVVGFDPDSVTIPEEFEPGEDVLQERTVFERFLAELVEAGVDKQTAVADINRLQAELAIELEAAAAIYCRKRGLAVHTLAMKAREDLVSTPA